MAVTDTYRTPTLINQSTLSSFVNDDIHDNVIIESLSDDRFFLKVLINGKEYYLSNVNGAKAKMFKSPKTLHKTLKILEIRSALLTFAKLDTKRLLPC